MRPSINWLSRSSELDSSRHSQGGLLLPTTDSTQQVLLLQPVQARTPTNLDSSALEPSLHEILQVLSLTLFEQVPILRAFGNTPSQQKSMEFFNQLNLLDL